MRTRFHFARVESYLFLPLIFIALLATNFLMIQSCWSLEPPQPEEIKKLRQTGELNTRLDFAHKLGNYKPDSYLLKRALQKARRMMLESQGMPRSEIDLLAPVMAPPPAWQGMPTTGNVRIFALLIEFQDYTHTNSQNDIHNNLFGAGDPARSPYESLATYYNRASYQQLNLSNGNTLGWYRTSYNRSSVTQSTAGRENLIKEALNHFDAQGHDFSQYDNDGNGVVDYFIVIWTGPDNGWANFWWGYQTSFSDTTYRLDGVTLGRYSWQWESRPAGGAFTPLVVIHETGHALGIPDYYDYDPSVGPPGGVGGLDIMDANKGDHNCFSKWMLDWITPTYLASGTRVLNLNASGTSRDSVSIWPAGSTATGNLFSEYFMVQNRQRVGNDNAPGMPGDGMLIWHVDAKLDPSGRNFLYDNSFTAHKLLRLMEADGLEEIETGDHVADAGDYYQAGKSFGRCTTPSSKLYDGTDSGIEVYNISNPGAQMSATFQIGGVSAADYMITDLSLDKSSVSPGDQVQVTYTAINQGGNPMNCINMGIFLSSDSVIDTSDTQLKTWGLPNCNLAACISITQTWAVTVPSNTADGSYYIGIFADVNNYEAEVDENNNTMAKPLTVKKGGGWAGVYNLFASRQSDIALLRKYRDDVLMKTDQGKEFTKILYESSGEALEVLLENPDLMIAAKELLEANKDGVDQVLKGKESFIYDPDKMISFLDAFAAKSPRQLKALAEMAKKEMMKKWAKGEPFLGFRSKSHGKDFSALRGTQIAQKGASAQP